MKRQRQPNGNIGWIWKCVETCSLASCVTYVGNLIDFNSGGYKALSHSLNIQVPLTEITLFTPRRCFERTAEKCYEDSWSSIVASCSWGIHVAVRIGSQLDVFEGLEGSWNWSKVKTT